MTDEILIMNEKEREHEGYCYHTGLMTDANIHRTEAPIAVAAYIG